MEILKYRANSIIYELFKALLENKTSLIFELGGSMLIISLSAPVVVDGKPQLNYVQRYILVERI